MSDSAPARDRAVDELLRDPAAERDLDPAVEVVDVVVRALGVRARDRHAQRHRARDDRDLAHRVRARRHHADDRVARLVVGRAALLLVGEDDPARRAEDDLLQAVREVQRARPSCDPRRAASSAASLARFAMSRADHAGRDRGDVVEVDVVVQRQRARVDLEDLAAAVLVGRRDRHAAVEAAGAQQRGVEDLGAVGRARARSRCRPVSNPSISVRIWLSVCSRSSLPPPNVLPAERLRPIASSSSMKMIAGAASLACLKRSRTRDAPMPTIASTNSEARDGEERHARLARDRAREQRLARAGPAREQHAARNPPAELLVLLRVLEEVDDLGQLALGLVDARDVLERDLAGRCPRPGAPSSARTRRSRPSARPPRAARARRTGRRAGSPGRTRGSGS